MMDALLDLRLAQEKRLFIGILQDEEVLLLTLGWHMESADLGQFFFAVSQRLLTRKNHPRRI